MTKRILTITLLLLGLATHISAQSRGDKENLEGLQDIGLVVKYGNADGLDMALQATTLQMLQDRAKDRLQQAGIPLLKSSEEAVMAGRPRLVFSVTLNKHTETASAIYVEGKVYERVRLSRDLQKEMELATWIRGGSGDPTVTQQMLLDVFDGQLNEFIRDYRAANPNPITVASATPNLPAEIKENSNSLQGLNRVRLFITFRRDLLGDERRMAELQKMFQKEAEAKLVQAGIPVVTTEPPILSLVITLSRPNVVMHAPPIEVEGGFHQPVRPTRNTDKEIDAVTWESRSVGNFAKSDDGALVITDEAIRKVLNRQLDKFIKAYIAANPSSASLPKAKAQ